jgi:hypothetical protein
MGSYFPVLFCHSSVWHLFRWSKDTKLYTSLPPLPCVMNRAESVGKRAKRYIGRSAFFHFHSVGRDERSSDGACVRRCWPDQVLDLVGGGTCSTAGGIKQFRIHLLWKLLLWELRRPSLPPTVVIERPIWEGDRRVFVDDARVRQISVFVFLYLASLFTGTMILCACGYSIRNSLFEFASAIGTVGLSVGVTSASMPAPALWAEMVAMFLGRLEFLVVIVSILKIKNDARRMFS